MKLFVISLGCDKNLVDTEHVIGGLSDISIVDDIKMADIIAVNTCCFITKSTQESIDMILEVASQKSEAAKIVVFGCMAKRYEESMSKEFPEVDLIVPSTDSKTVIDTIVKYFKLNPNSSQKRITSFPNYSASLKIAEGCDKNCTYCVIPKIRGRYKSIPMEELIKEAEELACNGTKELLLVAQESCSYGIDIYGKKSLHILIQKLSNIEGIEWIRLLYAYPEEIYDELIKEMSQNHKVCHYIDMPIQSGDDNVLKLMGRKTTTTDIKNIVSKLRDFMPDISIRTTVITGFPGETKAMHENTLSFIKELCFTHLGCFTYSNEEGAASFNLPGQLDEDIKEQRYDEIMTLQYEIAKDTNAMLIGKTQKIIVDGLIEPNVYQGRSYRDTPEIDSVVFFYADKEIISGDFVEVKISETNGYDLKGELI